jgi:hypothetical protein
MELEITDSLGKGSMFCHLIAAFTSVRYRLNKRSNPLNSVLIAYFVGKFIFWSFNNKI